MLSLKRRPLLLFFILAFLFPWLIWGTTIAQARGVLSFHIPQSLAFWVGLNLATYITAAITGGKAAILDLFKRILRWQVNPVWYLAGLLVTAALSLAAIGVYLAAGGTHQVGVLLSLPNLLPSLLFQIFFFLLTEETAWRGFALPRLQAKYDALTASVILGVLWGLWHLPLVFIPGSFQSSVPFSGFVLSALATSLLATWIFNHSKGSVLVAAVFHGATDAAIAYLNVMTGTLTLFWIFIAVQWVAVLAILAREGAARLSRGSNLEGTTYPLIAR